MFSRIRLYANPSDSIRRGKILLSIQRLLLGLLLISAASSAAAGDSIPAFSASYDLFRDDTHVGESLLKTEKTNGRIEMQMITKPGGLLALFTSQQPVAESTMIRRRGDFRLHRVQLSISPGAPAEEIAVFDWKQSLLKVNRKSSQAQMPISKAVYDYLSIHWLAAQMSLADADDYKLKFYRNGSLFDSTLTRTGTETLEINGNKINTIVYEQNFKDSSRQLKYHYDENNLWLPVRIERSREGKKTTVLLLKSVSVSD